MKDNNYENQVNDVADVPQSNSSGLVKIPVKEKHEKDNYTFSEFFAPAGRTLCWGYE